MTSIERLRRIVTASSCCSACPTGPGGCCAVELNRNGRAVRSATSYDVRVEAGLGAPALTVSGDEVALVTGGLDTTGEYPLAVRRRPPRRARRSSLYAFAECPGDTVPRLALPTLDDMKPEQRAVYAQTVAGRRGSVPANVMVWLRSPDLAARAQKLGELVRYDTSLKPRHSELAILVVAKRWHAQYEWAVHASRGAQGGPARCAGRGDPDRRRAGVCRARGSGGATSSPRRW